MDRAPAPVAAAWKGRQGSIGYLAKMFPRLSETFILEDILALRRHGVPVRIYSLLPSTRDARVHSQAAALLHEVEVLPEPGLRAVGALVRDLGACFRIRPWTTARQLLRLVLLPSPRAFRRLTLAAALATRLRRDRVAHLHAAWAHTPASVARIASRLSGVPWSLGAHAKDVHLSSPSSLAKKVGEARFSVACSGEVRDLLAALAPQPTEGPPHEVLLLHHGVDAEYFSPAESDASDPPIVLSVGRLVPKKGFDLLLQAANRLWSRRLRFCLEIVGDGPERRRLEQRVETLGLSDRVRFRGVLVREEVRAAMRRATCFALAARVTPEGDRDGIPNTLAEAMAVGLPVVATRLPGIEELVSDSVTGRLVMPDDPEALASALEEMLTQPDRARELGRAARARMVRAFDAGACGARRALRFARALGIERALVLSADRGVPVRGHKGASVHLRSMVAAFRGLGVETAVLAATAGPEDGPAPEGLVVEARSGARAGRLVRLLARLLRGGAALERALLRLLDLPALYQRGLALGRAMRPDLLYERYALTAIAGSLLARRLHAVHVLEVNAPLVEEEARFRGLAFRPLAYALEGWILRRADRVVVVSEALVRHARRLGVPAERITLLPNGVDPALFMPAERAPSLRRTLGLEDRVVAGFCGTLKPWHGVHRLIEAAARLPDLGVLVVGDGPLRGALESQARARGLGRRVRFVGAIPHDQVGAHLAACDVLVAPYEPTDSFYFSPLKLTEYLAAGRPVVASAVGALADLGLEHGVVTVPAGNVDALASSLGTLARDPKQRATLGRAAAASTTWTWRDVARAVLASAEAERRKHWGWDEACPMTVAYVLKMFPRLSETFVLREILELERRGARVVVFSLKRCDESVRQPSLERLVARVHAIPPLAGLDLVSHLASHVQVAAQAPHRYFGTLAFALGRRSRSALLKFLVAPWVVRVAGRHGAEHLHAHFASGPARLAKLVSLLSGKPFSFTAHAKDLYWSGHRHLHTHKLKKRVRLAAFVATISDCNRRYIEGLGFRVPRRRLVTVYNGLDLTLWRWERRDGRPTVEEPGQAPLLLAAGRLVEKKGFHDLIEACARLAAEGVPFRCAIAGEGPTRSSLEAHLHMNGLEETVELLGAVPEDRLRSFYRRAAVLVQPSVVAADGDRDGIPTVILEAMAIGLPVVATPVSGIEEAVRHGESGLLCPPHDPGALARAIQALLRDEGLCARLASGARASVEERFDLRRNADTLLGLMRRAARGRGRVPSTAHSAGEAAQGQVTSEGRLEEVMP